MEAWPISALQPAVLFSGPFHRRRALVSSLAQSLTRRVRPKSEINDNLKLKEVSQFGWLVGWLFGWLVVWLVGWLVVWLFGCLAVWLAV